MSNGVSGGGFGVGATASESGARPPFPPEPVRRCPDGHNVPRLCQETAASVEMNDLLPACPPAARKGKGGMGASGGPPSGPFGED